VCNEIYPDNDLIRRCQDGDKNALQDLLAANSRLIQTVSARMTRNPDLQQDIFQEVIIRVMSGIRGFKGNCKFSTWLYRITVNVTLTMLEKENWYKKMADIDDTPEHFIKQEQGPNETIERKDLFRHAMNAVTKMAPGNREIFSLFYFADASIDEISRQTGKSGNAIKAVLFKGRKEIADRLKKQGLFATV
jgi:RNA polymerase sigma-70 factor (ECF subfamily)